MGGITFATVAFFFFSSFAFEGVNCIADSIVITTVNQTILSGCEGFVVYCVFRPNSTDQGLDTWEIDANQEGYCVNRNAWKETGERLYSKSYLNDLSCPLSIESLAIVQSMTETNLGPSSCNVTVAESRPSSATVVLQNPPAFLTALAESAEPSCAANVTANQNQNRSEESCLTSVVALFLNASLTFIEEIDCDATQNAIGFRLQVPEKTPKGSPNHPLCGGTEWEIAVTTLSSGPVGPGVSTPAKDCEAFYDNGQCNLAGGGLMQVVDGLATRIRMTGAEQELGEFEVSVRHFFAAFSGESFAVELLYDGEVIVRIDVENPSMADEYIPFVVVPSKGIYKIVNEFRTDSGKK